MAFAAGDQIQVVWVGQSIDGLGNFGASNLSNIEPTATADTTTSVSSLTNEGPFEWGAGSLLDAEFGAAPTF